MMHAVLFAAVEIMKMMIKLFFVPGVQFQFINLASDLKRFLKMIGFVIIAILLVLKED